jgi:hypothetical protein
MLSTPGGRPARAASAASASAVSGASSLGLQTTVQPAASAGATLRVIMEKGKFQGVMAATTPTGWRSTRKRVARAGGDSTSPATRGASSANHRMEASPVSTSLRASASGLPHSRVMRRARSSRAAQAASCQRRSAAARSRAGRAAQGPNAAAAAAIAARVSGPPQSETRARRPPVAGLSTSKAAPLAGCTNAPPTKAPLCRRWRSETSRSRAPASSNAAGWLEWRRGCITAAVRGAPASSIPCIRMSEPNEASLCVIARRRAACRGLECARANAAM